MDREVFRDERESCRGGRGLSSGYVANKWYQVHRADFCSHLMLGELGVGVGAQDGRERAVGGGQGDGELHAFLRRYAREVRRGVRSGDREGIRRGIRMWVRMWVRRGASSWRNVDVPCGFGLEVRRGGWGRAVRLGNRSIASRRRRRFPSSILAYGRPRCVGSLLLQRRRAQNEDVFVAMNSSNPSRSPSSRVHLKTRISVLSCGSQIRTSRKCTRLENGK